MFSTKPALCVLVFAAVLNNALATFPSTSATAALGNYPGNTDHTPSGNIDVAYDSTAGSLTLSGALSGLEASCTDCGIHIHEGYTCDDASEIGGHYWKTGTDDVWIPATYTTDSSGSVDLSVSVTSDLDMAAVAGRAIVLHGSAGSRHACGVIEVDPSEFPSDQFASAGLTTYPGLNLDTVGMTTGFSAYPGYTGSLAVSGTFSATGDSSSATSITYEYDLTGLEVSAEGGLHVHVGTTCETAEDIGGHYWADAEAEDPWTTTYTSDSSGASSGSFIVDDGYTLLQHADHAIVVHAADGTRIACSILRYTPSTRGQVIISEEDSTLSLYLTAYGLQGSTPVVDGSFHVHEGTTCEDAGGHLDLSDGSDPWGSGQSYTVAADELTNQGKARTIATATVSGFTMAEISDKAFVIHASDGNRIACGVLSATAAPSASPSPSPSLDEGASARPALTTVLAVLMSLVRLLL